MAFNFDDFKKSLSASFGIKGSSPIASAPDPKKETLKFDLSRPLGLPTPTANSTMAIAPKSSGPGLLDLINPMKPVQIRPLFARSDQTEVLPVGGVPLGLVHDVVARTIEAIPSAALTLIANVRALDKASRHDFSGGEVKLPFDPSRLGLPNIPGRQGEVVDSATKMITKYVALEHENPGRGSNVALAALEPVTDALNAFITGDALTAGAQQGLKATAYSPELDKALQIYGLKNSNLTGEELAAAFKSRFISKATRLIEAGDSAGLRDLGEATHAIATQLTGKGIPQLNTLGQMLQDVSRLGLQDAKYGFTLKNPLFAELSPEVAPIGLPGTRPVPNEAADSMFRVRGLEVQPVERVGGAPEDANKFFRSKVENGEKKFEPVEAKPVQIQEGLDTGLVKQPDGKFTVIEGKTGMQLGEPAAEEARAIQSAWEEVQALGSEGVQKAIDSKIKAGEIAPRYQLAPQKNPSVEQGIDMLPPDVVKSLAPLKRLVKESAKADLPAAGPAAPDRFFRALADGSGGHNFVEVPQGSAKPVSIVPGIDTFVVKEPGKTPAYTVLEGKSGRSIGESAPTPEKAIANAHEVFQGKSVSEIEDAIKAHEPTPRYAVRAPKNIEVPPRISAYVGRLKSAGEKILSIKESTTPDGRQSWSVRTNKGTKNVAAGKPRPQASNPAAPSSPEAKPGTYAVPAEPQSYEALADNLSKKSEGDYQLYTSAAEEEKLVDALTQIFSDLKGENIKESGFTPADLEASRQAYEIANEILIDHPGRALMKYVSKKSGLLPEIVGEGADTEFGKSGKDLIEKILGPGATPADANKAITDYRDLKQQVGEVQARFRSTRDEIRAIKQKNQFVESAKNRLATRTMKDLKDLQAIVKTAERAGFAKGSAKAAESEAKFQRMIERLKERRSKISALQEAYNLSDVQMKNIRGLSDPRFMDDGEFNNYLRDMQKKAEAEQEKNVEKSIIDAIIKEKDLKNPENLRAAMELPKISEMTLKDLQEYSNALSRYQQNDAFLGTRMIQTIMNTDLGDVKTIREIREKLAKEAGVPLSALEDVRGDWTDKFTYDAALAEKNPLYKYMVTEFTGKLVETDQVILAIEHKIDELAKAARKSAQRPGIIKKAVDKLVPQDKKVFDWLERPDAEQDKWAKLTKMTPQELEYGEFVKALYRKWRDVLVEKGTLKKWREAYVTHTTQSFFEHWKDDGLVKAVRDAWKDLGEEKIDFEAVGDTGEVLGLEKFFKYSLPRFGNMKPSTNVARVVMSYARSFYKKQALDAMIPKLEAYTFSLQRPQNVPGFPRDPSMVGIDGKMRKFVRQWLNNKKGRRTEYMISQGSKLDSGLKAFKLMISLLDLGVNIISNTANMVGNTMSNFFGLETKAFVQGATRSATKQGRSLLRKYPGVVGHPPFRRLVNAANDVGDTFSAGMFYLMSEGAYRAKGQFFLGSLTPEEYASGNVSTKRQTEIKLEMGKFHPMEDMTSLVGSTSEGKLLSMYKTWAVPLLYTASRNSKELIRAIRGASGASGKARAAWTPHTRQLLKLTIGAAGAWLFWQTVFGNDDPNDDSPIAKLKRRISQELTSSLSALDPQTWLQVRPYEFAVSLAKSIHSLVLLERYQTTTDAHKAGDLKAVQALQNQLTPAAIRQFMGVGSSNDAPIAGSTSGKSTIPALKQLERLKKQVQPKNPSLKSLDTLKKRLQTIQR